MQDQPKLAWPASFVVARAYLDQLERSQGLSAERIAAARRDLAAAEHASGQRRRSDLTRLASTLSGAATGAADPAKVRTLVTEVTELAHARS